MKISKKSLAVIALGVAGVALTIILGIRWRNADNALTITPHRKAETPVQSTTQSYVSLPIRLSSTAMSDVANKLVPMSFEIPRQRVFHDRAWTRNPINGNEITLWSVTINGYGTISRKALAIKTIDGAIDVSMPIHGWFRAYKGGAHETAEADADVRVTAAFDVDEDWNPVVTPSVNYHWINRPEARLFGLFTLSLGSLAERQINTRVAKLKAQLPALLENNLPIRSRMETIWSSAHSVIKVSDNPATWVSIDPVAAFMQKPSTNNGDLVLNIGIVANLMLSNTRPATPQAEPLPPLSKQAPDGMGGFKVNPPIHLDYGMLSKELTATIGKKPIEFELPNGDAKVVLKEVTVYPAAPRLALGALIEADLPDQWLDTKGWIYVYATPKFDPSRKRLVLTDIEFSRAVDNKVASALTLALRQRLIAELNKLATIELKAPLDVAIARTNTFLNEGLDQHIRGALAKQAGQFGIDPNNIDVSGEINGLDSVDIALLEKALVVTPTVRGNLSVAYRPTALIAPGSEPAVAASAP